MLTFSQPTAASPRSSGEAKRPPRRARRVGREQAGAQRLRARPGRPRPRCVLWTHSAIRQRPPSTCVGARAAARPERPSKSNGSACGAASSSRATARDRSAPLDAALACPRRRRCRKRTSAATVAPGLGAATPCSRSRSNAPPSRCGVGRRVDDAEGRRRRVLGRARRVRVERVALVEERAEQLLEAGRAHASPRPSSSSTTRGVERRQPALALSAAQPRRACRACSRTQPLFG